MDARATTSAGERCAATTRMSRWWADDIVIEALLDDVLDATVLEDSVSEALRLLARRPKTARGTLSASW